MKKYGMGVAVVATSMAALTACMPAGTAPVDYSDLELLQKEPPKQGASVAIVQTSMGDFSFELYEEQAPNTVAHFKQLVEEQFYDQTVIYSIEKDINIFLAGATDATGESGKLVTEDGAYLDPEISKDLWHFTGAVSAFGTEEGVFTTTVQADSRFFVTGFTEADAETVQQLNEYSYPEDVIDWYKQVGGQPIYTGQYTIFGQIFEGMDTVEDILAVASEDKSSLESISAPIEEIVIEKITLSTYQGDETAE